jgi:hypothetical protein
LEEKQRHCKKNKVEINNSQSSLDQNSWRKAAVQGYYVLQVKEMLIFFNHIGCSFRWQVAACM